MQLSFRYILVLITAFTAHLSNGQSVRFAENKGQWNSAFQFRANVPSGFMYLEKGGVTYNFLDKSVFGRSHAGYDSLPPEKINAHAVKVSFEGSNPDVRYKSGETYEDYANYFIGNDKSKWASRVQSFKDVEYQDVYPGIDLKFYQYSIYLKYDFIVQPGANPSRIRLKYNGADSIYKDKGDLIVKTSVQTLKEKAPLAYQEIDGVQQTVPCHYVLKDNEVSFHFPEGYDTSKPLIIDPVLIFSTYSGSTADNFGFTSTYDANGNAYGGGIAYETGQYPVTAGAYQINFAAGGGLGARVDMAITKFTPDGSALMYSTYLGGSASCEAPHSLVTDDNGNLFILGTSGSNDYPVTTNGYDNTFNGGSASNSAQNSGVTYDNGCDIVVTKLSADGTTLLSSTYIGGSGNDGLNELNQSRYFYGDWFRGEIILDNNGNPVVSSTTFSSDFPMAGGSPNPVFNGGNCDAVVFRMNDDLSNLLWSTYWGGSGNDTGLGVQQDNNGDIIIAGGTSSNDMLTSPGALNNSFQGIMDGYLTKFSNSGASILSSTYLGTGDLDITYFVQIDDNNDVYTIGVSEGSYPVTPGAYSNPNSNQFIQKLDNNLTTSLVSTVIGSGNGAVDISPTAFLVNNCGHIYLSGWGGSVNGLNVSSSSTNGLPLTADATQSTTDGEDFYLMVLNEDATGLIFATYFGGTSGEHVDGGTSRFSKDGVVYQAVCAGCGGNSDFPTTPGAWSTTNNSTNCNLAVFKYGINEILAEADFTINTVDCAPPVEVVFDNESSGAVEYIWDYGDGSPTSDVVDESHFYNTPGDYTITLIAIDSNTCNISDTAYIDITVPAPPEITVSAADTVCIGESVQLEATGGETYVWSPSTYLDDANISNPVSTPLSSINYTVTVTDTNGCVADTTTNVVVYPIPSFDAGAGLVVDIGENNAQLNANIPPNSDYYWTPPSGLSCTDCPNPIVLPNSTTTYTLHITDENGCPYTDTVTVYVPSAIYVPNAFTPNYDGMNDDFKPEVLGIVRYDFYIFNRWGEVIFHSDVPGEGWDGFYQGKKARQGVYVWKLIYSDNIDPEVFREKYGHLTLIR